MNITQVITLVIVAWLLGFLRRYQPWKSLLIFTSMSLYYWLQPSSPIRYVDFWLPTFVVILAWLTYAGMSSFRLATLRKNIGELGLVLLPTLIFPTCNIAQEYRRTWIGTLAHFGSIT